MNIEFPWSQNLPHVDPVAGPAQSITPDDVLKSLRHMKNGKVAAPSGVVAEMLKATLDIYSKITADLMNAIIRQGKVPANWSDSIIVSLFKRKGDALHQNNYCGLKLTDHVLKVIERVVENIICGALVITTAKQRCGVVVITTAQLHSTKLDFRFCAGSNPGHGMSEIRDGEISDNGPG